MSARVAETPAHGTPPKAKSPSLADRIRALATPTPIEGRVGILTERRSDLLQQARDIATAVEAIDGAKLGDGSVHIVTTSRVSYPSLSIGTKAQGPPRGADRRDQRRTGGHRMSADLPFECPSCGLQFGLGDGAGLLAVFAQVPVRDQPTPCCDTLITGYVRRHHDGDVELTITSWQEDPS
jgi:hypothetical protein